MTSPTTKERGRDKLRRIPVVSTQQALPKPPWIKTTLKHSDKVRALMQTLRDSKLVSVCEEASCPNLHECFSKSTASFMIMGDICTRRCSFCDVAHGKPNPLNADEPRALAETISKLQLRYVVITSVDRDDLIDGGAEHFSKCIQELRTQCPTTTIEILTPDFRGRGKLTRALSTLSKTPPDVFNHNIETVPRLYKSARPGSQYQHSLTLLKEFKKQHPSIPTKSGLMLGLGESDNEVLDVLYDLRTHDVDRLTLGQYLAPSRYHLPVERYVAPEVFTDLKHKAEAMGFSHVASGPMVRSSYHADKQAMGEEVC